MPAPLDPPAEAFFLASSNGRRYCLFHPPQGVVRGALLYVHPFGEEMNKTRRMVALQARALAALGYGVLQIDLYGCGDSSGELRDARWAIWKQDIADGVAWLARRSGQPVGLWGLRLGALLALDYARTAALPPSRLVLWQPVNSGAAFLTNFLRLRVTSELVSGTSEPADDSVDLRAALRAGKTIDIGGYELSGALAAAIDAAEATSFAPTGYPVDWFDVVPSAQRPLAPGAAKVASGWRAQGATLQVHLVHGQPFWATQEIVECSTLLAATSALLGEARLG